MKPRRRGFSLPELMISMTLFAMTSALIVVLYHSVVVSYRHNFVRLENSDRARETFRRIVPLISSACPSGPGSAIIRPSVVNVEDRTVVLSATNQFIEKFIYDGPGAVPPFVPFRPLANEFGTYRIRFVPRAGTSPAGQVGDVWIDPNTPPDTGVQDNTIGPDDRCVARNIYDCTFENVGSNRIELAVTVYGLDRTAINKVELQRLTYRSEVWLPFYSNTIGN